MKKLLKKIVNRREVLTSFMMAAGVTVLFSGFGCCFYIFHQPNYPKALLDKEQ